MSSTTLRPLIESELELMEHFLFSLEKENGMLLESYSNDELFDLTELKNHYADELTKTAELRDQALASLQLPQGREGLMAAQTQYEDLDELIKQLFDVAEQAKQRNEENGLLIQAYLDYSVQALEALNSASPTGGNTATAVYDAKGKARPAGNLRRGIIRA